METLYKQFWDVVQRRLPLVLLTSAAAALFAYLAVVQLSPSFEVHFSYLISLSERETAADFRYDDYYALSATDLFAATVAEWLLTPEVIVAAYREAGLVTVPAEAGQLVRVVSAQKKAPQLVAVIVRGRDQQQAQQVAEGLKVVMTRNVEAFQDQGEGALKFSVYPTDSWVGTRSLSPIVITTATFIFVFLALINLIVLRESFNRL